MKIRKTECDVRYERNLKTQNDFQYSYGTKNGTVSVIGLIILVIFIYLYSLFH